MLDLLARAKPLAAAIGAQGRRYAQSQYDLGRIRKSWLEALAKVARR
jgi:hypothetical protein